VVIGGSHGKTTITSMVLHVLRHCGMDFDYMVGAQLEGFDTMVRLTHVAPVIILEGDEYLASPIDRRPKFHLYHATIGLISGIAWDHINVFPVYSDYVRQFGIFAEGIPAEGCIIYCSEDGEAAKVCETDEVNARKIPYGIPVHSIRQGITELHHKGRSYPLQIFGTHNLLNLNGAKQTCMELGISEETFLDAITTFKGAARRLEKIDQGETCAVYRDFAHSPSKLSATTLAVRAQFPERQLIACMELHTFSSLNDTFLNEYRGTMNGADHAIVYFNPQTIAHKKLPPITAEQVIRAFGNERLEVFTDMQALQERIISFEWRNMNLLMMSSGTFDGLDLKRLSGEILGK
jgi:UDP-N-acetylmuramate: L-alanyl-gamma-D-glutamyl-meso-diaminopimelate ligase